MANPFYEPGEQRAVMVGRLFARIAPRYDLLNDVMSLGWHRVWKRKLVRLARPQPGERALDVCCGTGDLALALARQGLDVVGLDFSEEMLTVARERTARQFSRTQPPAGCARAPQLVHGDAQQLPFAKGTFDIVTVGYGLRNLTSWETGLREMVRVSKPGGRLLVLDFGKPPNPVWRRLYFAYLRSIVPCLGLAFCGNAKAYGYILESLKHYPAQTGVAQSMRALEMQQVRVVNLLGGVMSINYGEVS